MNTRRQVLFIQGGGKDVHDEWDDKLVASLRAELGADCEIRYPRMPNEDDPNYAAWSSALSAELARLRDGAILIAHSIGATIMIHALAENPPARRIRTIVLVSAPFVGEGGWPSEGWRPQTELGEKLPRDVPVHLFQGDADDTVPPSHAELYVRAIPQLQLHRLRGRDHQLNGDLREVAEVISA